MIMSLLALLFACRPDPIEYPYNSADALDTAGETENQFGGPDPYEDGDSRLSLGVFYEGGYSDLIPVDDETSFFYIWITEFTSLPTYTQTPTTDRVEGNVADEITAGEHGWFGGGVSWNIAKDMSAWTTLFVSVKSESEALSGMQVGMGGALDLSGGCSGNATRQNFVDLTDYGFLTDGEWHHLEIPISDLTVCMNVEQVAEPFMLLTAGLSASDAGATVLIDNVYFTGE